MALAGRDPPLPGDDGPHKLLRVQISGNRSPNPPTTGEIQGMPAGLGVTRIVGENPGAPRADWADEEQRVRTYIDQYPARAG